jgi:hypothetical protein
MRNKMSYNNLNNSANSAFDIDSKIEIKLDYEFAVRLGNFILNSNTIDKQIKALGFQLSNLEEEEPYEVEKEVIRKTNKIYRNINSWKNKEEEEKNVL